MRMLDNFFSLFGGGEPQGIPRSIKDGVTALRFATQRAVRRFPWHYWCLCTYNQSTQTQL